MMTSPRPRLDVGGSFDSRRGHASQLSITDPAHHVTEAIGTLYGDDDDVHHMPSPTFGSERPLSFVGGHPEMITHHQQRHNGLLSPSSPTGGPPPLKKAHTMPAKLVTTTNNNNQRANANAFDQNSKSPISPTFSLRDMDTDKFSLTEMQGPGDIAQELSNLQALRRMSMDVGNSTNPDIPPFMVIPSLAPSGDDDEDDLSRLLWVPARAHPEISPSEYKSFVKTKRRSGEAFLSPDGSGGGGGGGGGMGKMSGSLTRKKSMLSRQIVNHSSTHGAVDYVDGADRLERKRSSSGTSIPELSLEELVNDPMGVVHRLARPGGELGNSGEDVPILPAAPPGMGLRRSTRTAYRKGGSLKGERVPFAKRMALKHDQFSEDPEQELQSPEATAPPGHGLARIQSEPVTENYSRPNRSLRRQPKQDPDSSHPPLPPTATTGAESAESLAHHPSENTQNLPVRTAQPDHSRPSPIPQIIETAPALAEEQPPSHQQPQHFPQRSSSQKATEQPQRQRQPSFEEPPARSSKRPPGRPAQAHPSQVTQQQQQQQQHHQQQQQQQQQQGQAQTVDDMAANPSLLPGGAASRTDSLTFIPTAPDEKKGDKKGKKEDDTASVASSKSTSGWRWFKSSSEDKERKKREEEAKKAGKSRNSTEKPQDNVRLDVLESFDNTPRSKSRESQVMDRDSLDPNILALADKGKGKEGKKEKDGIFSSLFGSTKKKGDKEGGSSSSKKKDHLRVIEEPPCRQLRPDVDYPYSRFPLLEERAIYRMAHIKLANPRRPLHSQVLLSNFMYSYLAIVQAMHPQMNVPTSPQQRRLEEEQRRKEREQQKHQERERQMALLQPQQQQQYHQGGGEHGEYDEYEYEDQEGEYDDGQAYDEYGNPVQHHNDGYGYGYDGNGGGAYDQEEYYDDDNGHDQQQHQYQQQQQQQHHHQQQQQQQHHHQQQQQHAHGNGQGQGHHDGRW